MRVAPVIELNATERRKLEGMCSERSSALRLQERAQIVLLAGEGLLNKQIAERLAMDSDKVGRWRKRYAESGFRGILKDKTRPGRIPAISPALRSRIVKLTVTTTPEGATQWSRESMVKKVAPEGRARNVDPDQLAAAAHHTWGVL